MDVRPGGVRRLTMLGPDGPEYLNRSVYKEVVRPERLVFAHSGGGEDRTGVSFQATVTFEDLGGGKTRVTMRSVFPSAEMREMVVREFNAIEGGHQTLERLGEHVEARTGGTARSFRQGSSASRARPCSGRSPTRRGSPDGGARAGSPTRSRSSTCGRAGLGG